jgi:hypothetical protein
MLTSTKVLDLLVQKYLALPMHKYKYWRKSAFTTLLTYADVCWRMLTYADVCWRMLTYADVCWRILTYADVCWRMLNRLTLIHRARASPIYMLTYADVCWRLLMLTYADVRWRMLRLTLIPRARASPIYSRPQPESISSTGKERFAGQPLSC